MKICPSWDVSPPKANLTASTKLEIAVLIVRIALPIRTPAVWNPTGIRFNQPFIKLPVDATERRYLPRFKNAYPTWLSGPNKD